MRRDVDVLRDAAGAFARGIGEDALGDDPFDNEIEARDGDVDTVVLILLVQVVCPIADRRRTLHPFEADQIFPVHFVERVFSMILNCSAMTSDSNARMKGI